MKWPYTCVTWVISLIIGVVTPFVTGRGTPCMRKPRYPGSPTLNGKGLQILQLVASCASEFCFVFGTPWKFDEWIVLKMMGPKNVSVFPFQLNFNWWIVFWGIWLDGNPFNICLFLDAKNISSRECWCACCWNSLVNSDSGCVLLGYARKLVNG